VQVFAVALGQLRHRVHPSSFRQIGILLANPLDAEEIGQEQTCILSDGWPINGQIPLTYEPLPAIAWLFLNLDAKRDRARMSFKLGFGGILTFERSTKLRALVRQLLLESLVPETNAPDMTVAAYHGERNSPEYVPDCLQALAQVRDQSPAYVAERAPPMHEPCF